MTELYVNSALDYLLVNGSGDFLLVDDGTGAPAAFPLYPTPKEMTIRSFAPSFISVTHGMTRQVRSRGAQLWQIELRYSTLSRDEIAAFWAFLNQREGQAEQFTIGIEDYFPNRGLGGGTPKVNGAGQTGTTLVTDGWPNSTTVLAAGDFFSIQNDPKVYQVVSNVTSNGSGAATITLYPALRRTPSDNYDIDVQPHFTVSLTSDVQSIDWSHCLRVDQFVLELAEVLQ